MQQKECYGKAKIKVVILGFGFGGLSFLKAFRKYTRRKAKQEMSVMVVSDSSSISYTPLLPLVSGGSINPSTVAVKISDLAQEYGFQLVQAKAGKVNLDLQYVETDQGRISFDYIIISTGSSTNHFGIPGAEEETHSLRTTADARILNQEQVRLAAQCRNTQLRDRNQGASLAIIGGGLSGVETAMSLKQALEKESPEKCMYYDRGIYLIEASGRVLPREKESVSEMARVKLVSAGIKVLTDARVRSIKDKVIHLDSGRTIKADEIIWTAGVKPNTAGLELPSYILNPRSGRIMVNDFLNLKGYDNAFAIGDCAHIPDRRGTPLPENASVAVQEGRFLGKMLGRMVRPEFKVRKPFRYQDFGHTIILGKDGIFVGPRGFTLRNVAARLAFNIVSLIELFTWEERRAMIAGELEAFFQFRSNGSRYLRGGSCSRSLRNFGN